MRFLVIVGLIAVLSAPALAQEGYMFWMPSGQLTIGNQASEKDFDFSSTATSTTFTAHARATRMGYAPGQIVIVRPGAKTTPDFSVDGKPAGRLGVVTFIPQDMTKGDENKTRTGVKIEGASAPAKGETYLIYYTDDAAKLGTTIEGVPGDNYGNGLIALFNNDNKIARALFASAGKTATTPTAQRQCRILARWANAKIRFGALKTGKGFYDLGIYCMVNGFWDLAVDSFAQAAKLMPKNADAVYMLADATSYKLSDLDMRMEAIYPLYKKAAELYPNDKANTFRTFYAINRKLRVNDNGQSRVITMTDEQIEKIKKQWEWCSAIMESASRGAIKMVNTFHVIENEVAPAEDWDIEPYKGMFEPGTVETCIKMAGWGASDARGMDCGPDRSAFINLGVREWDVMLHEWNHTLDWLMLTSGCGIGVVETHQSDTCGYEPIPSMGMGHHSTNRYYMTPGMYQTIHGSDVVTTPYITDWTVAGPMSAGPDVPDSRFADKTFNRDEFYNKLRSSLDAVVPPAISAFTDTPKSDNGYVDLKATFPTATKSAYAFAHTYVYSPVRQKVRLWFGSDDNFKLWVNGVKNGVGVYWTCAFWEEAKEKDQAPAGVWLEKGWNSLTAMVTNVQDAPGTTTNPDAWGFSVRFCDMYNKEIPGLKVQTTEPAGFKPPVLFAIDPKSPKTYKWDEVKDDYTTLIPSLTIDNLRDITGYKTLTVTADMLFDLSKEQLDPQVKQYVTDKFDPASQKLDNAIVWNPFPKEMIGFIRYKRGGQMRDLLFLRPEAYEPFLSLMPVSPSAKKLGITSHADQVIGYYMIKRDTAALGRGVVVVDTYLGDKLPTDEEALLDIAKLK